MSEDLRKAIDVKDPADFEFWVDSIRSRAEIANHTSNRARYTLIFLSLVSAGFVMSTFSYFYSWNKHFVYEYLANVVGGHQDEIRSGIIKEWLSTQTYQLPILGIKIMASDIQTFSPLVLLVVSTWNYYEVRREHYTVGRLLGDVYIVLNEALVIRNVKAIIISQEVYHRLIGHTVFNVIPYDNPIVDLDERLISGNEIKLPSWSMALRRGVIKFLALTPLLSILFVATTRVLTFVNITSPVTGKVALMKDMSLTSLRGRLLLLSFILIVVSLYICYINAKKIFILDRSTRSLLDRYQLWSFKNSLHSVTTIENKSTNLGEPD